MRFALRLLLLPLVVSGLAAAEPANAAPPEAMLVIVGDVHSAYDRVAQLVAHVDRLKLENRHVPLAVLINGDVFEAGNVIARRSDAQIDYAFFAALAKRAPVVLNLGNHEMDFDDAATTVKKLQAAGVTVISGNARDRTTGKPLAPASTALKLGAYEATVVGVLTDRLATFRLAVQPQLDLADPVVWAKGSLPALLNKDTLLPILLSHAGSRVDDQLLLLVPPRTLFAGGHDHLRLIQSGGRDTVYFHSGSWLEGYSLARLQWTGKLLRWQVTQVPLEATEPGDPDLIALVRRMRLEHLTPEDNASVGQLPKAMRTDQAAEFAAAAVADAAGVDMAFIGNTTFGAGLPAGSVTRVDFDACVRFDGAICTAIVDGERLRVLMRTPGPGAFRLREGEFNFKGGRPGLIDANKAYRIATTDWGAKNSARYFGEPVIEWEQHPTLKLKAAVLAALAKAK